MKRFKGLLAALIALFMVVALVPSFAFAEADASRPLTKAEREARIASLLSFMTDVTEMKKTYADTNYAAKDASDLYATARIIVKSKDALDYSGSVAHVSGYDDRHVIQYKTAEEAEAALKEYSALASVEYAVPDRIVKVEATPGSDTFMSWGYGSEHVDAYNYNQWLYAEAGSDLANLPTIIVAVIDTGADTDHPYLVDRLVPGYDFIDNDSNPEDGHSHGSHVSGTVMDGTFSNVKVMPIRVLDDSGYGDDTSVSAGIEYGFLQGCQVENMSLGGDCDQFGDNVAHPLYVDLIGQAYDNGCTVCVAAGNDSEDANLYCPANVPRAFTVGSIDSDHTRSWFSNYGEIVDIAAPGSNIRSCVLNGGYGYKDGTSMATPHVSAACALVRSFYPDMSADDVVTVLKGAAVDIGISNLGAGMLNVTDLFKFDSFVNAEGENNHFTSTGAYVWNVVGGIAESGNAGHNNSTSTLTSKLQLGAYQTVTFDVKVSSEEGRDFLRVKANGQTVYELSGEHDWQTVTVELPTAGFVTVNWEFAKDASGASGQDKAFVRNVSFGRTISTVANAEGRDVHFATSGDHPWTVDDEENAARSAGEGPEGSVSVMTAVIPLASGMRLGFDYKVQSSGGVFRVRVNGQEILSAGLSSGWQAFEYYSTVNGSATVEFIYTKASRSAEYAMVKGFAIGHVFESAASAQGESFNFLNSGSYPWEVYGDCVRSTNQSASSSESAFSLTLVMQAGETLSFRYKVSSETNYDWFDFTVDGSHEIHVSGAGS